MKGHLNALMGRNIPRSIEYVLALCVPFVLGCVWYSLNRGYPIHDSADYIQTILPAAQALKNGDIPAALEAAYWQRGWKTILLPVLIGPFLAAVDDVRLAVALCNLALYLVFLIYTARVLRLFVSGAAAVLSTWLVGTLPWVLTSLFQFLCELPFLAAGMAALYYLFRNADFRSRRQSWWLGISLSMAFCVQPFVAVAGLGLVYAYFFVRAVWRRNVGAFGVLSVLAFTAAALAVPYLLEHWDGRRMLILAAAWACALAVPYFFLPKKDASRNLFTAHAVLLTSCLFWFTPFRSRLFSWAFECTVGTIPRIDNMPAYGLTEIYYGAGGGILAFLALAALFNVVRSLKRGHPVFSGRTDLLAAAGLLFGTVLVALYILNNDPRYHYLGFTFLYVLLAVFVAGGPSKAGRTGTAALVLAVLYHAYCVTGMIAAGAKGWNGSRNYVFHYPSLYQRLLPKGEEEFTPLPILRLFHRVEPGRIVNAASYIDSRIDFPPTDVFYLMGLQRGKSVQFFPPYYIESSLNSFPHPLWRENNVHYVLVGFFQSRKFDTYNTTRRTGVNLVEAWRKGKLGEMGLELMDEIPVKGRDEYFLLMRVL